MTPREVAVRETKTKVDSCARSRFADGMPLRPRGARDYRVRQLEDVCDRRLLRELPSDAGAPFGPSYRLFKGLTTITQPPRARRDRLSGKSAADKTTNLGCVSAMSVSPQKLAEPSLRRGRRFIPPSHPSASTQPNERPSPFDPPP